jgi:hypothetical protein
MKEGKDKSEGTVSMEGEIEMIGEEMIREAQKGACLILVSLENLIGTKRREQHITMILRN